MHKFTEVVELILSIVSTHIFVDHGMCYSHTSYYVDLTYCFLITPILRDVFNNSLELSIFCYVLQKNPFAPYASAAPDVGPKALTVIVS